MKDLTLDQIEKLEQIGKDFDCEFCFPPFKDNNNTFFHIDDLVDDHMRLAKFLVRVNSYGVDHKFHKIDGKKYLEVLSRE